MWTLNFKFNLLESNCFLLGCHELQLFQLINLLISMIDVMQSSEIKSELSASTSKAEVSERETERSILSKQWRHKPEVLTKGCCNYNVMVFKSYFYMSVLNENMLWSLSLDIECHLQ